MVWGVSPLKPETSWEGHLFGAVTGFIITLAFAKKKPFQEIIEEETVDELSEFSGPTISDEYFTGVEYYIWEDEESEDK